MNIGFFDSGLGGILILKSVVKTLPQFDYIYYGDTKHLPYGDRTEGEVYELTKRALDELFDRDCSLVIVACNTASAETLRKLQDTYLKEEHPDRRVLGVIVPTLEEVVQLKPVRVILLATQRTVDSGKYERELLKLDPRLELRSIATPELVPLIEAGKTDEAIALATATLDTEAREGDVVILGCTHYVRLKEALRTHFNTLTFIAQDEVIPHKLENYLDRHPEIVVKLSQTGKRQIVLSEHRADYDRLLADFLNGAYLPDES
ncbi:MAG TPA: glutamate racemase [Candidatus Paceibacterota bacterium]